MNLVTELPLWYSVFCVLLGLGITAVLYYRDHTFGELSRRIILLMSVLRFVLITLLALLLLSPLLKSITREVEKPIVVLALDNSKSLKASKDSLFYKNELITKLNSLADKLQDKYDVKRISFGEKVSDLTNFNEVNYSEKQTDLASVFSEIQNRFSNRNVGVVIIASDGLYNRGANPVYSSKNLKVPVYTVALGDTGIYKDLILSKVNYNKTAFLGNNFPIEILINARRCSGSFTKLTISEDSAIVFTRNIEISGNSFNTTVNAVLDAKKQGAHHYTISLSAINDEATLLNNKQEIFIEVLERKQKVLLLANAPHPDLSAIKQSLEASNNLEVNISFPDKFSGDVREYNLLMLFQLPSTGGSYTQVLEKCIQSGIPVWYMLGAQTDINQFNAIQKGMSINQNLSKTNEALPFFNDNFSLFSLSDEAKSKLKRFSPLHVPFGKYSMAGESNKMLKQQIGLVKTENPLLVFFNHGEIRTAVLCGEGLWKWRLNEFAEYSNHYAFDELMLKTVQYLSSKEKKVPFAVHNKNSFPENEPVLFDAELFNESNELINTSDVSIEITNREKKSFPYTFNKTEKTYSLNAGYFPSGIYHFEARVISGERKYQASGNFTVTELQAELTETVADHSLLYLLAQKHEGQMVGANEVEKLADLITKREDVKPVIYTQNKFSEIINLKWVFFLLLLLLASEWFLRKRNGGY